MSQVVKGNLPITIWKKEQENAIDYRIYGTLVGTGVQTENLVTEIIQNATINNAGTIVTSSTYNVSIAPITAGTTYTLLRDYNITMGITHYAFFANLPAKGSTSYDRNRNSVEQVNVTFTAPITGYVVLLNKEGKSTVAEGNTAIPYGYKIPLTVESGEQSGTYPLYIGDSKLGEDEYLDYGEQKIYKRTANYFIEEGSGLVDVTGSSIMRYGKALGSFAAGTYTISYTSNDAKNLFVTTKTGTTYNDIGPLKAENSPYTFTLANNVDDLIIRTSSAQNTSWSALGFTDIMFVDGSTAPQTYIPYLQPTDPPTPLPTIQAYQGENTLFSSEECGSVSLEFNEATFYAGNSITQVYTNNQLYDLIDPSFYSLIANSYDSTQTYEIDSCCIYNYCLYKCITAIIIPEIFNPAKWQQITLVDFFQGGAQWKLHK